jgi:hypothetical protein
MTNKSLEIHLPNPGAHTHKNIFKNGNIAGVGLRSLFFQLEKQIFVFPSIMLKKCPETSAAAHQKYLMGNP